MKPHMTRARLGALAAATVVATSLGSTSLAATLHWQVAGTTNNWSTAPADTNWFIDAGTTLSPWADANVANFNAATGEAVTIVGTVTPGSITADNAGSWTLNGGGLIAGAGSITKDGAGTFTLANTAANTFGGGVTVNTGTLAIGTGGTGANTATVSALGTGTATINAAGTLKLWIQNSTAFTIANPISINGGSILNEDGNHTLSGAIAVGPNGANLRSKWNGKNLTATGVLSGDGGVTVTRSTDGGGHTDSSVVLTNSNTYTGNTTVNSAVLQLGNNNATDKGTTGVIRGTLTVNSPGAVTLGFTNALGYGAGLKVNTFNINGATVNHSANGDSGWGVTYNMTGGLMQTTPTGTGRFAFGGGTSVNTVASNTPSQINGSIFMRDGNPGNTIPLSVAEGGAPYDLAINANVTIGGNGANVGFTKTGPGTLLLNGANTYSGATNVNEGNVVLGPSGSLAASAVNVAGNAGFHVDAANRTVNALAVANNSTLGAMAAPGTTTTLTGVFNRGTGTFTVTPILGGAATNGVYDLVTAGSITGSGTPVVNFNGLYGPSRATGSVAINGNKLQLTLTTPVAGLVWNNASLGGAATGTWDLNASTNFNNGGANDVFKAFDAVTLDDSLLPGTAKTLNLAGTLAPSVLTANNSNGNYTLNASVANGGLLAGGGTLVKSGTAELILGGNMSYAMTGGITANAGTLNLGAKTLPGQNRLTLAGGTVSNGTLPVTTAVDLQQGTISAVLTGAAPVTKSTAGTAILSGNNTMIGAVTVNEGVLQVGAGGTTGSLGSSAVTINTGGTVNYKRSDNPVGAIANAFSGTGTLIFEGTGTNLQGGYGTISGNNSGFSGTIRSINSRIAIDNVNDIGTSTLISGTNGQFWVTGATHANSFRISGNGWLETNGPYGAIRIAGGTISGPVTLEGDSRITTQGGNGTISGVIGETGAARNLEIGIAGGSSNLTLSGVNTYTGATTLSNATLNLRGSLASSAVNVGAASTIQGNGSIAGSLSFAAGATNLGVNLGLPGTLTVTGAANVNGGTTTVTVLPNPSVAPGGSVPLLNYGSTNATAANFALANPTNFRQAVFTVGANTLSLNLGSKALTWSGTGGLTWDIATTANWLDSTPAASPYYQGDVVTFTDAAGVANANVTIGGTTAAPLTPATVTVNNSAAVPYTFGGAGSVGGGASFLKQGTGDLNFNASMVYTGGTVIDGGRIIADGNNAVNRQVAGGIVTINNTGTFEVRGVNALPNSTNSINPTVNAGGTLRVVTGTSAATSPTIGSHAHLGNITLNGGTVDLTYSALGTGTTYNGESFQLNGNVTVGGSTVSKIQSTEAAALQGIALAANRTFAVANATGNADTDLLITAEVENSDSDNGALTKTGAGTLELAAANSYSGGTTVNEGTLVISNGTGNGSATGTGAVTIATGTTLAGNGGATGAVSVAGTITPGPGAGVILTGAFTLSGTYNCDIDGDVSDTIVATGNVNFTGSTLNVTQLNAPTAPDFVIASWTGTRTGTFQTVTGLPAGMSVIYDDDAKLALIGTATGFQSWVNGFPGLSNYGENGDPDSDGISNLLEYILGGNPGIGNPLILPTQVLTATNLEFSFKRTDLSEGDTDQIVQWSTDLETWNDVLIGATSSGSVAITENGAGDDDVKVTIPRAANTKIFARLMGVDTN